MYNLRYHIASLVGVFIALSVGLLLGTIVAERGTLDDQRDALINSLERDFDRLAEENARLAEENGAREDFVNDVVPALVGGVLEGKTVIVLANLGRTDGLGAVRDAVTVAGGTPLTVTVGKPGLGIGESEVDAALASVLPTATADVAASVAASLAVEWTSTSADRPLTTLLEALDVIGFEEPAEGRAADAIVVVAAWPDGPDLAALDVAVGFADAGRPAVGAQALSMDSGIAAAALDRGLDAVDTMGIPEGAFALDWLLSGRASGYYGRGDGAEALYPKP